MKNAKEISIGDAIKQMLKTYKIEGKHNAYLVVQAWKNVMGNMINKRTKSVYVKDETLFIFLSSSVLRQELNFGKNKIIDLINQEVGKKIIKNVEIR